MNARQPWPEGVKACAREMHAGGDGPKAIHATLGVPVGTLRLWLYDPDGTQVAARKERYRGTCVECGATTSGCNGKGPNAPERCADCNYQRAGARISATNHAKALPRYERIAAMWNAGSTAREIAAALGTTPGAVNVAICRLRRSGWDVPHHYPANEAKAAA